eukprot:scaffold6436_cov113-Isochrysis_galbana.AAC.9
MNVQAFLSNIYPTAFFAFIGTFASTFVVGGLVYYAGQIGLCYPLGMCAATAHDAREGSAGMARGHLRTPGWGIEPA